MLKSKVRTVIESVIEADIPLNGGRVLLVEDQHYGGKTYDRKYKQ